MSRFLAIFLLFFSISALKAIDFHFESQRPPGDENREIVGPRTQPSIDTSKDKDNLSGHEICQIFDTCRMNNCIYLCRYINNVYIKYIMTDKTFEEAYKLRLELSNSMDYLRLELPTQNTQYKTRNEQGDEVEIKYEWKSSEFLEISMSDKGDVIGTITFEKKGNEIIIIDSMSYVKSPAEAIKESMENNGFNMEKMMNDYDETQDYNMEHIESKPYNIPQNTPQDDKNYQIPNTHPYQAQ
ncbi:hypothetical protein DCO58_09020 [Helicobacter saguini]|uniref:Uncharacterized protein n=1 Tax=Helicobacter saguini TaxID=1548018 RepID=A0A347VP24_9HELI|nr:hypothetical protein [Helicobacter saguini]MWV61539.1 hypothetical protein [Helicobacter saguini]MWV67790.1 hypothetical protein [Helicobacter saguini]MWV70742.1 hypothetical protein [Helicobacter saguini]MWV72645.1 hypothetical protein [Helicobacter saguini]TLD94548.1 hypothetical protein LS64_005120 [Helicobacter saguini]